MTDLREAIDALPRYVVVVQPAQGWTKEHGRASEPVIHEAVLLADVRKVLAPARAMEEHGSEAEHGTLRRNS